MVDILGHLPHDGVFVGLHGGLCLAGQCAGRGIALPAALAAAGALDAVLNDDVVAHFASRKVEAAQDFTAQDDAAADAGAQGDDDCVVITLGAARNVLAVSGGVGIVFHIDLTAQHLFHVGAKVPVIVAEVRVEADKAGLEVHAAGGSDAHIVDIGKVNFVFLGNGAAQVCQCLFQILRRAGQARSPCGLGDDFVVLVDQAGGHGGAAQIDTNGVLAHNKIPPTFSAQIFLCNFNSRTRFSRVAFTMSSCGKSISSSMA